MPNLDQIHIEKVAAQVYIMWMRWAKKLVAEEVNISMKRIQRWEQECFMPYEQLSEEMKQLDRDVAIKIIENC